MMQSGSFGCHQRCRNFCKKDFYFKFPNNFEFSIPKNWFLLPKLRHQVVADFPKAATSTHQLKLKQKLTPFGPANTTENFRYLFEPRKVWIAQIKTNERKIQSDSLARGSHRKKKFKFNGIHKLRVHVTLFVVIRAREVKQLLCGCL